MTHDTDALVSELKCGKCGLPIERGESGVRYYGVFVAHSENRCLSLLHDAIDRLTRELGEAKRLGEQAVDLAFVDADAVPPVRWMDRCIEAEAALSAARAELASARNKALEEAAIIMDGRADKPPGGDDQNSLEGWQAGMTYSAGASDNASWGAEDIRALKDVHHE